MTWTKSANLQVGPEAHHCSLLYYTRIFIGVKKQLHWVKPQL